MNRPLWNTQNDLAETVRSAPVELLNLQLADVEAHGQGKD